MGKITSYKDFKNNVQSIRDELTKQGYTPRSVPSEQKEETKNTKKIEKGKGLFKETGKSSFNDIPKIQELQNEYQKAKDWGFYDYTIDQIKKEELPTKFGNVNMNKRPLIRWNDELKKKYENELKSWGYDPEIGGIDTVFGGSDKFGTDINNSGWNVAYTPIMPDGTFLDKGTVDNYMNSLVKEAYEKNGNVTNEELETLDKKGMQVGDKYVHGIFAGVDGDEKDYHKPYSAEDRGKLMHFSGKYGAINIAKRGTDNLKTNPNEEQSDSDEKEEYLNQQVDIPITDNKSISLKYRTVKTIDNFLKRNKEKNKYKKAQQLDEMIDKLDLSENELKNAKSYAGLKKLSLMSSSNGKDSVLKELGQFVAYPIGEMYDFAKRAERTYVKDGFPFKVQQMGAGDYSEQLQELDKYYSENPDELGNDFFNRKSTGNDAYSDYMDNLRKVKAYEAFDNTNPVTHFIAEKGLGSMGQMLAAYGTAGLMGLPDVTEGVSSAAKKVAGGTKIGQVVSKVANATPDIANVAEKGIGSKIANAAINKANNLSIGSAAKFLNPLDNSTTLLMGIDSAQQKYDDLVKNGYDKDTAYKNAMFTGYVNTITEKMGYDGTPESMMFALSPTGSTKKNVGKVLKQYMKANVGEGLEEVYATLFERMGDVVSKVGYVDENGKIQQRKLVGKEGVIDLPALGESFLGGAVGGAVMGGAGVVDNILHTDAKSVRQYGDEVKKIISRTNKEVSQKVREAGAEMPELPKQIDWKKSSVAEMNDYFVKTMNAYRDILSDEKVINYDKKVAENTLNKMNTAETGNDVNEATNINNVNATPQTENSIQNVPKTLETEPLQTVQETAPLNAQANDISNINTQNSKINADNSTISDTTSEINSVDTLNEIGTLPNISTQENGVQSSVNRVTDEVHNAMNKVGLNVSESATGIQEANTRFMSSNDNLFDKNYVSNYANDFVQAMSEKSGRSYTVLSQETNNLADELVNKTLTGNSVLDGNREFQTVVRNFKDVLREGIKKNANLHNNVYGANEVLNAQVQDIENGDYSSLNITENPNNNVTFAPITENEQNIGYIIERDNGYSNELSESDFTVKQKNGEYGTRNGITYGHFGTHQNSNGNNIVSYLPTGNAVAILPNQNSAIEFMKQAENETSGYSIYLYDDNGVTKTGGDMSQFINVLNNAKNAVQVEQNSGNVGIQSNTGVSNNAESEKINSQAPNTDENTNTTQTDNAIKSIEISEEDKIPGLLQDEYSDLLSLEDRTALDTLGSAIGVPIKIVPTISNDANGCYYKGVIYISLSADDKVMTVFSHELTHYLEDTLDYTEYKKCVLDFIQKNTDKSIDELAKEKVDTYAKSSINLTYEEATREIVADYTQNILKDADAVMEFVDSIENKEQKRGVIRRLLDAIKELINKIKAKFSSKHSQMQDLQKTHDLLEDMLKEAAENIGSNNGSKTRYSYAGTKAETANITQLSRAKEMELNGEKVETIRAKTGWNRGLDGKWRFEIDDSKMEFDKGGITSNPDVTRKKELEKKLIIGTITEQEQSELNSLINTTKDVRKPSVLQDYIKHDELFRAYPFLKTVDVEFDTSMQKGEHGRYIPSLNTITLNAYDSSNQDKSTLIHEIQHAIQHYEDFATGANVEYWKVKNGQDIESLEREIRKNSRVLELYQDAANNVFDKLVDFDDFEDKTGLDFINLFDEDNMKKSKAYLKEKLPEGLYEVSEGYIDRGKEYAEKYISLMKKLRTLKEQTAMDLYKNTAGEIEARDVQNRMNMTEEERKNTFPESMKKNGDVVFANKKTGNYNISINEDVIGSFGIKSIQDYVNVQRSVKNTLLNEGFFSDEGGRSRTVINRDSGMVIQITPRGIKETFGEKNFYKLGRKIKIAKLAVVRDLPDIIKRGKLLTDNVENVHNPNSAVKYAYIESTAIIDGHPITINIDVRKSPDKNIFWVHKVDFAQKNNGVPSQEKSLDMGFSYSVSDSIPQNNSNVKYSFGGKNSKIADIGLLQKAETLEKDGASAEEIRKETGWSRGLDNKWKFEIDDSKAKYKEEKIRLGKAINLNEVLEHEDLFKAYPDLKKVKVKEISDLDARGVYSPNFDCIFINENLPTQKKLKSLIHEVQHAIQVREGFAVGESPDNENRNQSAGEIEADDVKARQSMSKKERLNTFPKSMKPNQNADVVFWENGKDTNKTKFSLKDNSDNENSNIDEKDVAAIQSIGQLNLKERGIINRYTYNKLAQKADMPVTKLAEDLPINSDGKINRADILAKAMNNVRDKNNLHNTENTSFIYVKDIDKNILVGKDALRHGLMRNSKDTAKVTTKIGDVLENAIKVNELKPRNNTLGGYVLMGIGIDDKGNYYPTRIIVNNYEVQKIEPLDVVYAVRTKKKNQSPNGAGFASKETPLSKGSSKISVSDFLDIVKDNFADTLPQDVLEKYNTKRPKSALSESVKYSIKESAYDKIENRLSGDDLLNAYDTIEEIRNAGGRVDENGYAYVYHNTSKDNAENIRKTGVMSAKEDGIFVSTKPDGQSAGYGNETVSLKIPVEKLVLDDMFDDELHFRIPLKNKNDTLNVSNYLIDKSNADNAQIKSDNFKNWFGDWENNPSKTSKVVNEDGTPKIVYHGTTSNFTTFDTQRFNTRENSGDYVGEGFFFTDKESTAKKYGSSVMPVYLNLRNPLIINTENDGKKFRSTFLNMYQKGNKELRDLIGGDYDYFSIMKENPSAIRQELQRRGYDGLIDNLYGQYAVFNSEQIKSATDNIGTFDKNNADIRYSSQKSKPTTVHSVSKKLISDYGVESKVKPSDISEAIADITSKINDTYYGEGDINRKYVKLEKAAYGVAEKIVDQMKKKDNYAEEIYNNLRKEIKSTKIRISEVDKGDFTEWNDFRKQNFGYLTISNKEGIPVDSYYKELAQEYPGMFDESTHMVVGDQLRNIVDTLHDLKPKEYDLSTEERNEMLEEVANEVILRSINLADDMGYIDKNGNADKIYTENDMRGALDKQKERLNNKHEKQLDRQKERLENKYEKRLETQKAKYIEQREKIRKQLIDKINKKKEKAKARKKESEDRTKLLKLAREINSMKLSPQDKNKLPDILKEIDTVSKGILKKGYTTKDGKVVMGELDLKQLKEDYELLKQDENFLPDKDVELKISRLDKMQIADMNINDVRDLIQTLQEVKHEIRTKDKMINDVRNREIAHTAMESIKEIQRGKGIENKQKGKWYRGYISTQLTPERMFRRLSGYAKNGVFEGVAKDLSDGQRKSMTFKQRASEMFKTVISKTEEMSKFTGKKAELIDISKYDTQGRKVYITPDMRTSLYLHSKNYSNLKHIQYGGITIPNMDLYKQGKIKDAYESAGVIIRLTPSQVNEITSKMTPFEKQFADVAYNFFNDDCSKAINETSIALKGYEIATVRDYFPIVSNRNFINNDFESLVKNGTLEGKGMLKERKYASNPVALESVIRAINRQMSDVADYYGLAIPIRNFNKVYNSMGRNYNYSVKESLKQKWGLNADKYIENLITDLQSGRKTDGTLFDMLKGHYAQGVLSLNLGVTLKQAASYPTAAAVVGYKPLVKAFSERVSDSDRKIIDKYTPLLWYRSQGYTTSEFGDYADGTYEDWTKKGKMPLLMGWIQAMDIATTTKLWKAAEFYVRDNYETLEQGTDEYYKQVADVYNSIIENTQPNYSTMQRPDILRNPNALVKSVTMFKTQVMQNFNILYDAYGEYNARYQDYQSNKTEENAEDLKSAAHNLGKAISSQIIAAIVLNLCDGIGRFLKGKFDDYYGEDDKDKTITLKSAMSAYLTDCFNTVMGTTLGGSETAALVEYILSIFNVGKGKVWYDIQVPALDTINNTISGLTNLLTTVSKNGASSPWAYVKSINKLLKELGTATGIPLKNGEALLYGIYKNITDWTKKENVFETLDSWTDGGKPEYTKDDGHKYRANMSIKEYKEYNAYYEKIVKDMQSGKIRKKNGEKYSSSGIKQAARKKANEKFEKLFTEKVE